VINEEIFGFNMYFLRFYFLKM